jgi:hypothetical protein
VLLSVFHADLKDFHPTDWEITMDLDDLFHVNLPNDLKLAFLLWFFKDFGLFLFGSLSRFHRFRRFLPYSLRRECFCLNRDVFLWSKISVLDRFFQYFLLDLHTIASFVLLLRADFFFFLENLAILALHAPIPVISIIIQDLIDQTLVFIHQLLLSIILIVIQINAFRLLLGQVPLPDLLFLKQFISIFLIPYPFLRCEWLRRQILFDWLVVFSFFGGLFPTFLLSLLLDPMGEVVLDSL